jgi:hypothetical protein
MFLRGRFSSVRQPAGSGVDCGPTEVGLFVSVGLRPADQQGVVGRAGSRVRAAASPLTCTSISNPSMRRFAPATPQCQRHSRTSTPFR